MMYSRYHFALEFAAGRRTLEIACAAGQGLGLLSRKTRSLVGGDYSSALLRSARQHYGPRLPLVQLSAERLPFGDRSFDLILLFEASYYVPDMTHAFREIDRVLAAGGIALFVNANPERPDFIRSPHSFHYHTGDEFRSILSEFGFGVDVEGAFPVQPEEQNPTNQLVGWGASFARKVLEATGLVPRTLRGRARLKRLVYGKLLEVPAELTEGFAAVAPRRGVGPGAVRDYKVIYVTAKKT